MPSINVPDLNNKELWRNTRLLLWSLIPLHAYCVLDEMAMIARPFHRHSEIRGADLAVEQLPLGIGAQQRMVGMLAVDVGQEFAGLAQLRERGR